MLNMVFVKSTKEKVLADPAGISYAIPVEYLQCLTAGHGTRREAVPDLQRQASPRIASASAGAGHRTPVRLSARPRLL